MFYKLNEEKMFCDITDGIAIVINSETGIYYGMNPLGSAIFDNIIKGVSTKSILETISKTPNSPKDLENKIQSFIDELLEKELIIKGESTNTPATINSETIIGENFIFEFTEYSDAQELLLADPIHDVKDETGWQPVLNSKEDDEEKLKSKKKKEIEMKE